MNNVTKIVKTGICAATCTLIVISSSTTVAVEIDVPELVKEQSLESYLQGYHPETYRLAKEKGIDLYATELAGPKKENVFIPKVDRAFVERFDPDQPMIARKRCEEGLPEQGVPGGVFLENNFVATCVSADGTFGNGSIPLGMTFNPLGTGTRTTPDYLQPGSPHEFFSVTASAQLFSNNNRYGPGVTGPDNIPTRISRLDRYSGVQEGGVLVQSAISDNAGARLNITQKYTLDPNSREIIIRVEMKNTGRVSIDGITYGRGLDPDQDIASGGGYATLNRKGHTYFGPFPAQPVDVEPQNIAWASGKNSKLSVALYSVDPVYHDTCISNSWTVDPIVILNQACNYNNPSQPIYDRINNLYISDYSDSTINIAFKIGTLRPNESKVFSFKYLFDQEKRRIIKPDFPIEIAH